jgi:hypothetical protein
MKALINIAKGLKASTKAKQMVLMLFIINLTFSLLLAVPMYHSLKASFGQSMVNERMAEGFDYLWWEEFRDQAQGVEKTFTPSIIGKGALLNNLEGLITLRVFDLPPAVLIFGLLYIILHTFLAGGILTIFGKANSRFRMKEFFLGAGTQFLPFVLLMLISWVFFFLIAQVFIGSFASILDSIRENAYSEVTPFFYGLLFSGITLFLFLFVQMVFDYGRIRLVIEKSRNVLRAALGGSGFVFRHLGSTLAIFFILFLAQVLLSITYVLIQEFIPQSHWIGVLTAFLIQQLFIFGLIWIRCWLYASQLELYRYLK